MTSSLIARQETIERLFAVPRQALQPGGNSSRFSFENQVFETAVVVYFDF
jgi:hypothetical protein